MEETSAKLLGHMEPAFWMLAVAFTVEMSYFLLQRTSYDGEW